MRRRSFLSLLAAASSGAAFSPGFLHHAAASSLRHVLILLELRGGNDGLNTVAPHNHPLYLQSRPSLAIDGRYLLSSNLALHPALSPLIPLWRKDRLCFVLGVGWLNPNRSHFMAADQWATANPSGAGVGWLAAAYPEGPLVSLDSAGCRAMEGGAAPALQLSTSQLNTRFDWPLLDPSSAGASPILRQMLELELAGHRELARLHGQLVPLPAALHLSRSGLAQQVGLALQIIGSEACPPVLHIAQVGYDTHANQAPRHSIQLTQLAEALVALDAGLKQLPRRPRVTLLALSEFGRRLQENGSMGTDHGSASVALLYGDNIPSPFLGHYPSLDNLDSRGDLLPGLSPIELYRTVLQLF